MTSQRAEEEALENEAEFIARYASYLDAIQEKCHKCGNIFKDDSLFCRKCGVSKASSDMLQKAPGDDLTEALATMQSQVDELRSSMQSLQGMSAEIKAVHQATATAVQATVLKTEEHGVVASLPRSTGSSYSPRPKPQHVAFSLGSLCGGREVPGGEDEPIPDAGRT